MTNFQVKRIYREGTWKLLIIHSVQREGSVLMMTNAEGIVRYCLSKLYSCYYKFRSTIFTEGLWDFV